ncbi:MAG: helix-turn-helix domain-containing protein [Pseudodonghicola sp.]
MSEYQCDDMSHVTRNIQFLVSTEPSISAAARRLGINRQQLNKYLNGTSVPSLRILRRFAVAFDLPTEVLTGPPELLPRDQTRGQVRAPQRPEHLLVDQLVAISENAKADLASYCGRYFRYHIIPTSPQQILRSYMVIYQRGSLTYAHVLERMVRGGSDWKISKVRRATHIVTHIQDRIQIVDSSAFGEEVVPGFSILYPAYISGIQYMSGMLMSSFGFGTRPIYESNLLLQRLSGARHNRCELKACGLFDLGDPSLNDEIHYRLSPDDGAPACRLGSR